MTHSLPTDRVANWDNLETVSERRLTKRIGSLDSNKLVVLDDALRSALGILVSRTVQDLVVGSGLTFEDAGEHELKGVPDRWHLYRVAT